MMSIHPVQSFKDMPTGKKIATVAGIGAVALTAAAAIKGKNIDLVYKNEKLPHNLFTNIVAGYSHFLGKAAAKAFQAAKGVEKYAKNVAKSITSKFHK